MIEQKWPVNKSQIVVKFLKAIKKGIMREEKRFGREAPLVRVLRGHCLKK